MQAKVRTVAFQGIDVLPVDVQVLVAPGNLAFAMVGLADKAVGESRERVRATFRALGLSLPPQRITVNLSPADLAKEGSHYDLPIALGLLAAMGVVPRESIAGYVVLGELALDGSLSRVPGVLPAAIAARAAGRGVICPAVCGGEAAWGGFDDADADRPPIIAAPSLLALINHLRGQQRLAAPEALIAEDRASYPDLAEIKGQESAKRVLEVAAAGGHNLLMIGPARLGQVDAGGAPARHPAAPGSGGGAGGLDGALAGRRSRRRQAQPPPHLPRSASFGDPAGAGRRRPAGAAGRGLARPSRRAVPRRIAGVQPRLAGGAAPAVGIGPRHRGARQRPRHLSRALPARGGDEPLPLRPSHGAQPRLRPRPALRPRLPGQALGPLLDRIDLCIDVPPVSAADLALPPPAETSADVAARVAAARAVQRERLEEFDRKGKLLAVEADETAGLLADRVRNWSKPRCNADTDGAVLAAIAEPDAEGRALLTRAAERLGLSARAWHRTLRVARTLADLDGSDAVRRLHIAEALSYRRPQPRQAMAA